MELNENGKWSKQGSGVLEPLHELWDVPDEPDPIALGNSLRENLKAVSLSLKVKAFPSIRNTLQ
jgi:hypothetical protein